MIRASIASLALFAAAACAQPVNDSPAAPDQEPVSSAPQTREEATAQDTCGASQYSALIGANLAAVTLPAGNNIRVIHPGTPVTQDFRSDRLNIITDANGTITSLECY